MGKCVVHPLGVNAEQRQELDQLAAGSVVIGGERYELSVEAELYEEFALTVGSKSSMNQPNVVDERRYQGFYIRTCGMTPDRSKLLFYCDDSGNNGRIVMLNLNTLQSDAVAVAGLSAGNGAQLLYLDNECLLVANDSGRILMDFRFSDSRLTLEHQMNGGLIFDNTFFDQLLGVPVNRFATEIISPYRDRGAVAAWTTAHANYGRITRYSYDKAAHTLGKTVGSAVWGGNGWVMNSRFVDEDTVLIVCDYYYSASVTINNGAQILLYHPSTMVMCVGLEQEKYATSGGNMSRMNIIQTGERRFAVDGHFQGGRADAVTIEVQVGKDAVEVIRTIEGSRFNEGAVYQDGERVWRDGRDYSTTADLVTWKRNHKKIVQKEVEPIKTGELTVGAAYDAIPLDLRPNILISGVGNAIGEIFVAKNKKLITALQRTL